MRQPKVAPAFTAAQIENGEHEGRDSSAIPGGRMAMATDVRRAGAKGNISVLMNKNFILKKRMYQKLVLGFFPAMLFMELLLPPAMLLGLTWVKMEAPLYMKTTGYGGWPVCNENERHPCTETTPIECVAGDVGQIDVAGVAARAGVASSTAEQAGEVDTISTCESNSNFVFQPDPFFYTLAALHWAREGGPKIALTASNPLDRPKVEKFQRWVSEHWYPQQYMEQIPCVDLEMHAESDRDDIGRSDLTDNGAYVHCANAWAGDESAPEFWQPCFCDGRVRLGGGETHNHQTGDKWTAWRNNTGWIDCARSVLGDPYPGEDYWDLRCMCDPASTPPSVTSRQDNEWSPASCTIDKCHDHGHDCCAPQVLHEVPRCDNGLVPRWLHRPCANMQGEGWYTCCPPEEGRRGPGYCHFEAQQPGNISSFSDVTEVYDSQADMQDFMRSSRYGEGNLWGYDILAAIVFHRIPGNGDPGTSGDWEYSLVMNNSAIWGVNFHLNLSRGWKYYSDLDKMARRYDQSRFLTLQTLVDRYIIHHRVDDPNFNTNAALDSMFATSNRISKSPWAVDWDRASVNQSYLIEPSMWVPQFVQFSALPIMGFRITLFYYYCDFALALLFILIYLDNMYSTVTCFIDEKETRMREVLRIQGVSTAEFIASWYLSYVVQFAGLNLIIAIVTIFPSIGTTGFGGIFSASTLPVIWCFLFLYSMCFVAKGFMIACFFSKARSGGIISCLVYLAGWFIQAALKYRPSSAYAKELLCFFSPVGSFAFGIELFSKMEEAGAGATLETLDFRPDGATGLCLGTILWLMCGQLLFYSVLGWYFDQVVPSQWGIKQKPWFFLLPSFWMPEPPAVHPDAGLVAPELDQRENPLGTDHHTKNQENDIERATDAMEQQLRDNKCILVKKLRKVFDTPDGAFVAVNDLQMTMYEGQIFSLLGHNGAGKTTTISMLTGMLAPTCGDATVYGKSVVTAMPAVREDIGFCPQHDVLYPSMTVSEHLSMFASLKGIPTADVDSAVMAKITDVGLTEKVAYQSGGLSGGQKRKLSLAMALIGDCKAVFLDEPTSGMDPYSRRSTWNMLQAARAGRVMVLTTHFMDEADILGDRIGIMVKGRLRCCGSSLFLKSKFGGGYNLAFAKKTTDAAEKLQQAVTSRVPGSKTISNIGTELKCQLPLAEVAVFPELFAELEARQDSYGFESYGIGVTTMEEVFLRVAHEGEEADSVARASQKDGGELPTAPSNMCCQSCFSSIVSSSTFKDSDPRWFRCGASFVKHLVAVYVKRARYGVRDRKAQICNIIMPIVLLWFGFFLMYDLLGSLIEMEMPEYTLSLDIVKEELELSSTPIDFNATDSGESPDVSRFPGGAIAHPKMVQLVEEEEQVFGVIYKDGRPLGESGCVMEPRELLSFSKQLLEQGMGSEGENVVYGAVMFPAEIADCCADYEMPCAQVQQLMVTGLGLDCNIEVQQLASPAGHSFLQAHIGSRGPVISEFLQLKDDAEGTAAQKLDASMQQLADAAALFVTFTKHLGLPELSNATLANFCPSHCAGNEYRHWNTGGALAALVARRYKACDYAKRAADNANKPIQTLIGVLQASGLGLLAGSDSSFITCDTTPVMLAARTAPLIVALRTCSQSFLCGTALNTAFSLGGGFSTQDLFTILGGLNQTAGAMSDAGMGDVSLQLACPATCGVCNATSNSSLGPAPMSTEAPEPEPAPEPELQLPICVDDAMRCRTTRNGRCDERGLGASCDGTSSCLCPATTDATDCADYRPCESLNGRRMQGSEPSFASTPKQVTILYNASFTHSTPVFLSVANNVLKKSHGGGSITIRGGMLPWTFFQKYNSDSSVIIGIFQSLVVCLFVIIAFSFVPGALVEFSVREREYNRNSKHQQYVSGISIPAYWFGAYLWDMTVITMPITATMFLSAWFGVDPLVKNDAQQCCFVLFLGYGLAICPFTYLLGHLFSTSAKAQIYTILFNLLTAQLYGYKPLVLGEGIVLMVASYILNQFYKTHDVNEVLMWGYRIFPGFCLGHGLLQIFINNNDVTASMSKSLFGGDAETVSMFDWDVAGKDLLYLYCSAFVYMGMVLGYDFYRAKPSVSKHLHDWLPCKGGDAEAVREVASQIVHDDDVAREAERVASGAADNEAVMLKGLQKVYPGGKMAVKSISVGIPRGECFGLLGINGAGKTSTLKILSGDQLPTAGSAHVCGMDVLQHQRAVRQLIGYCPQFDALLDLLTVREHLELFSRIKNVAEADLNDCVQAALNRMDLQRYANKLAGALSGGNKRKLCVAMAIIGNPKVVFLDEPSTGVDPVARRFMWDIITQVCEEGDTTVILTTHNMEECEALCTRLGIMVGGYMRCLGSITHLRDRFGKGYQLELKLRYPSASQIEALVAGATDLVTLPAVVQPGDVVELCATLGNATRAACINADDTGGATLHNAMEANGFTSSEFFVGWFILQDWAAVLVDYVRREFGGVLLEQHEQNFRFNIPSRELSLSRVFRQIEAAREPPLSLEIQEYAVSQTSLEQVFNGFAAQQEEEQRPVRGMGATQASAEEEESGPTEASQRIISISEDEV